MCNARATGARWSRRGISLARARIPRKRRLDANAGGDDASSRIFYRQVLHAFEEAIQHSLRPRSIVMGGVARSRHGLRAHRVRLAEHARVRRTQVFGLPIDREVLPTRTRGPAA